MGQQRHVRDPGQCDGRAVGPRDLHQRHVVLDPGEHGIDHRRQVHIEVRGAGREQCAVQLDHRHVPERPVAVGVGEAVALFLQHRGDAFCQPPRHVPALEDLLHRAVGEGALQPGVVRERLGDLEEAVLVDDVVAEPDGRQPERPQDHGGDQQQDGEEVTSGGHPDTVPAGPGCVGGRGPGPRPVGSSLRSGHGGSARPRNAPGTGAAPSHRGETGPSAGSRAGRPRGNQLPTRMKVQLPE